MTMIAAVLIHSTAALSVAASAGAAPKAQLACLEREIDRLAADPAQAAELRRWTRWEAVRLLWSEAGDGAACPAGAAKTSDTVLDAAYRHAATRVRRDHLYRGEDAGRSERRR